MGEGGGGTRGQVGGVGENIRGRLVTQIKTDVTSD